MFKKSASLLVGLQLVTTLALAAWGGNSGWGSGDVKVDKHAVDFDETVSAPSTPSSNRGKLYLADNAGTSELYLLDSTGTPRIVATGAAGAGDVTRIGDCTTGDCFEGTAGTTLTFNNAGGDKTLDYDGTDFLFNAPLDVTGALDISGAIEAGSGNVAITNSTGNLDGTKVADADLGDITFATGAVTIDANAVALGTDTTGAYVSDITAGTAIDVSGGGAETANVTVDFDSTEIEATTWGAGGNASNAWTFNVSGTDPLLTAVSGGFDVTGDFDVSSTIEAGSGNITITNSTGNLDGTKVADADLGDITVTTGAWAVENDSHDHTTTITGKAANVSDADFGDVTVSSGAWAVENDSHTHGAATLDTDSVSADELNATGVEAELEAVLDLDQLQGTITDAQIAAGAVDGGSGGEIADNTIIAEDIDETVAYAFSSTSNTFVGASYQIDSSATGVSLDTDGDGMLIMLGTSAGNDEDLRINLDDGVGGANTVELTSSTGVTDIDITGINLRQGENTSIVLDPLLSADGKYCGVTEVVTAGATIAFGDVVYLKAADSQWYGALASADATAGAVRIAIAVTTGADNGSMTIMTYGKINAAGNFPALTVGAPAYISGSSAGDIVTAQPTTTDHVIRIVGYANTGDELFFCPSDEYITHI